MAERRTVAAVLGAGVVVLAVTAAVALFGVRRLPAFPAVTDAPAVDVPGTVAYLTVDEDDVTCLTVVAAAGGDPRTLLCGGGDNEIDRIIQVAWSPDGRLLAHGHGEFGDEIVLVVEATSGEVLDRIVRAPDDAYLDPVGVKAARTRPDGAHVLIDDAYDDGHAELAVRDRAGTTRRLVSVEGPRDYAFTDALWSPGGEWILVRDSERRLLVVAADGATGPRLLVDRAGDGPRYPAPGGLAWFVPGDRRSTVDPAALPRRP